MHVPEQTLPPLQRLHSPLRLLPYVGALHQKLSLFGKLNHNIQLQKHNAHENWNHGVYSVAVLPASCHSLTSAPCPGNSQQYMYRATADNVDCIRVGLAGTLRPIRKEARGV